MSSMREMLHPSENDGVNTYPEQVVIGMLLYENSFMAEIETFLLDDDFSDSLLRLVYIEAKKIISRQGIASPFTIAPILFERGAFPNSKDATEFLALLAMKSPVAPIALGYAKMIRSLAKERALSSIAERISFLKDDHSVDIDEKISVIEQELFSISQVTAHSRQVIPLQEHIRSVSKLAQDAASRGNALAGIPSGLTKLDELTNGFSGSQLIIIGARPSMGKTALAVNIAMSVSQNHCPVAFFSAEMSADELALRIVSDYANVPSDTILRGECTPRQLAEIESCEGHIKSTVFIDDSSGGHISVLASKARQYKKKYGIGMIFVDYLGLFKGNSAQKVHEVADVTQGLKAIAKDLNIPVIALCQLNRESTKRDDKRPQLSDLRDSGAIEQEADAVIFLHREEYYISRAEPDPLTTDHLEWESKMAEWAGKAELIVAKQRRGRIGTVRVNFESQFTRFTNL